MSTAIPPTSETPETTETSPTRFFLRGLAISLPPILTIVILIWLFGAINHYIITPTSSVVRYGFAHVIEKSVATDKLVPWEKLPSLDYCGTNYRVTPELKAKLETMLQQELASAPPQQRSLVEVKVAWVHDHAAIDQAYVTFGSRSVPYKDFFDVASTLRQGEIPATAIGVYMELVTIRYFKSVFHLSAVAVVVTIIVLYFLGRIVTVRIGRWMWTKLETGVLAKVPVVSNVYSSVKQVTDFFLTERTVSYNRVVAVEYPRKGIWSIGFVTGEGMREIAEATGDPMLSILMPTSPMPMTGFTVTIPKKDVIDLDLTIDQAFQFCLSCGVLIPPHQKNDPETIEAEVTKRLAHAATPRGESGEDQPAHASTSPPDAGGAA